MHEYLDPRVINEPKATAEIWTPPRDTVKAYTWSVLASDGAEDEVTAHNLNHEHGSLVFSKKKGDSWIPVIIFAPGEWKHVMLIEPEGEEPQP